MPSARISEWVDKCNDFALKSYTNKRAQHCAALIDGKNIILLSNNSYGSNKLEHIPTDDCTTHAEVNVILKGLEQNILGFDHSSKVELAEWMSAH